MHRIAIWYTVLSGLGWILDFIIFFVVIDKLGLNPGMANVVSATVAAMSVYFASQFFLFAKGRLAWSATSLYFVYTEANIIAWALAIQYLSLATVSIFGLDVVYSAIIAKCFVTPFSLVSNFYMSRWVSSGAFK